MPGAISNMILIVLDENGGEVHGTGNLAEIINTQNITWLRQLVNDLEAKGEIIVVRTNGGRGHRNIIRKRNMNSAGSPRRMRRPQ